MEGIYCISQLSPHSCPFISQRQVKWFVFSKHKIFKFSVTGVRARKKIQYLCWTILIKNRYDLMFEDYGIQDVPPPLRPGGSQPLQALTSNSLLNLSFATRSFFLNAGMWNCLTYPFKISSLIISITATFTIKIAEKVCTRGSRNYSLIQNKENRTWNESSNLCSWL